MKKVLLFAAVALGLAACSSGKGDISVTMPKDGAPDKIIVERDLISDLGNARQFEDLKPVFDTLEVKNGHVNIPTDERGDARYLISVGDGLIAECYTSPGESLKLDISSYNPLMYTVSGTQLMEDISRILAATNPLNYRLAQLMQSGRITLSDQEKYMKDYDAALKAFVKDNPNSPAVIYALFNMQGESFKSTYDNLTDEAKKSILMPMIANQVNRGNDVDEEMQAMERERAEKARGDKDAPGFTFKDVDGKSVSLSDFRGKWVVLDFWGTWCGWCVKGIPALKDAYKKYAGKMEVIGIDCNEPEADWKEGVKHYELPWVNVYNDQTDGQLLKAYSIEGFPTKCIINPEGKLVDITTGDDPAFYDRLEAFINGSSAK